MNYPWLDGLAAEFAERLRGGRMAHAMLLSGPAGGLVGARFTGELAGRRLLLSFDMGGTSTDVALIDESNDASRLATHPSPSRQTRSFPTMTAQ